MLQNNKINDLNNDLSNLMEEIKRYTPVYVDELCITKGDPLVMISCLSKDHEDNNPSMGYYRDAHVYHCFSCLENFDIFRIAHEYEDKPLYGKEFIRENVFYLAEKFNISYSHISLDFSPEDLEKFKQYDVFRLLEKHILKYVNYEFLEKRNIKKEIAAELKIGSVNWEILEQQLEEAGIEKEFYNKLGLNKYNLNENKLVLIIKDDKGRPVSFVSREMIYTLSQEQKDSMKELIESAKEEGKIFETKKEETEYLIEQLGDDISLFLKTPKYTNGFKSLIYNKSNIIFGYSDVKTKLNRFKEYVIVEG